MRASLFLRSRKKPIWTPKMMSEVDKAVKKATMLMPADVWAVPLPESEEDAEVPVAALPLVVLDILAVDDMRGVRNGGGSRKRKSKLEERQCKGYVLRVRSSADKASGFWILPVLVAVDVDQRRQELKQDSQTDVGQPRQREAVAAGCRDEMHHRLHASCCWHPMATGATPL